jgi:hypothetical protein
MLDILITNYWTSGEGAERGLRVTASEVKQALQAQYPRRADLQRFLRLTGEHEADDLLNLRTNIMTSKIEQNVARPGGPGAKPSERALAAFLRQYPKKWRARTTCRPGYVVSECREYRGAAGG